MINIILFQPEKPLNTGNIMRTCMAAHAKLHIIGPISFSINDKDLKRAGLDYINDLNYVYYDSLQDFNAKNPNITIFYISRYGEKSYNQADYHNYYHNYYIMFGRESTGIPHDILRDNYDHVYRIPMIPDARSLNLSNAVAIVLYEALRQQNYEGLSTSEIIKGEDYLKKELGE